MKYIKLMESFDKSKYYVEVPNLYRIRPIKFEVNGVFTHGEDGDDVKYFKSLAKHKIEFSTEDGPFIYLLRTIKIDRGLKTNEVMSIMKMPDEWYYAQSYGALPDKNYKCDQLEGLKKLIEDLFYIE